MPESEPINNKQSEKEAQGLALLQEIEELRSKATTQEDHEAVARKIHELKELFRITPTYGELSASMIEAKEIMNKDSEAGFFGPEEIKTALGIEGEIDIPEIPFSKAELERAKELDQFLILRMPMSMQQINGQLGGKVKDGQKLTYSFNPETGKLEDNCWYKDEGFYIAEQTRAGWALVSKELVPNTTSKNYLEQTQELVEYLANRVFAPGPMPTEYKEAISEFLEQKGIIEGLLNSDWKQASEMLTNLKITKLTRQNPAETLYDLAVYFQTTGERLLPNVYTWTSRRDSSGRLVLVGDFDSDGVDVSGALPGGSDDGLGVSFSRSR
jgi:hypothetical protein